MCCDPKKVGIVCEGQTEVNFIKYLSSRYFYPNFSIILFPVNLEGRVSIERVAQEANRMKAYHVVSTFVDYYGFVKQHKKPVKEIENKIASKVKLNCFIPYLQMHETEALWFSDIDILAKTLNVTPKQKEKLQQAFEEANGEPEKINNTYETAPSKRLEHITDHKYKKTVNGQQLAEAIPLDTIKARCPRFKEWLDTIKTAVDKVCGNV